MNTLYWYPGCSTCKKAVSWLRAEGVAFEVIDLKKQTPSEATLRDLWERSEEPIKKFFNTSGQSYRGGGFSARLPEMSDDEAIAALAADGMLIKRPILDANGRVFVGFRAKSYDL